MTTDASDVWLAPTMTGLFVAGLSLGAVYALGYTRIGELLGAGGGAGVPETEDARANRGADGEGGKSGQATTSTGGARKRRRKDKDKVEAEGKGKEERKGDGDQDQAKAKARGAGRPTAAVPFPRVIPGDLEGVGADTDTQVAPPASEVTSKQDASVKTQQKKKRAKKQKQKQSKEMGGNGDEAGSETDKEVEGGRVGPGIQAQDPRSGESTDTSMSPFLSGDALPGSSRVTAKGSLLAPLSQAHVHTREVRPSLSFDTDSSWTHVDRRRLKASKSTDGQAQGVADAVDTTSSDLASVASDSPVADRMDNVTTDMRGARADTQRTLAEKLVPKLRKTGVEDMLEKPDVPTLTRVMRVQPPADETLVPGFSWDDYGEVVEDNVLAHDADEEDEGEWGVVKSRHRTRPPQAMTTLTTSSSSASISASSASAEPATMTKKQRQNARKRELAKAAKAEAETARLQGLAKHKRELDRLRIIDQSRQGGGKQPSGGMQAMVDDRGKLVWE